MVSERNIMSDGIDSQPSRVLKNSPVASRVMAGARLALLALRIRALLLRAQPRQHGLQCAGERRREVAKRRELAREPGHGDLALVLAQALEDRVGHLVGRRHRLRENDVGYLAQV